MKRLLRWLTILFTLMVLLRFIPGLAALWQEHAALPLLQALHRLTAALPFPLLEPLALASALALLHRRTRRIALAVVVGMYMLWVPVYFAAPAPHYPAADAEAVCMRLIEALSASPLSFDAPYGEAGTVAGLPWARVKPTRYPEWMRALGIAGLFSPWTGEALVDPDAPPGELPFTCVHELQHLKGIADEGAANIAAYRQCAAYGGYFADSARLWALRYAMARLDDAARSRVRSRMGPNLRAILRPAATRPPALLARLLGISNHTDNYDALVDWLMTVDF